MGQATFRRPQAQLKSADDIDRMRRAGALASQALHEVAAAIKAGITTRELNQIADRFIRKNGGIPTFVGYRGYPAALCVSVNEEVVHGIPGPRVLKTGDLVSIDVAATVDGFVGDNALSVIIGEASSARENALVQATKDSLYAAIDAMQAGKRLGDVCAAVENFVKPLGFDVVRDFVGHGIGRAMHEEPAVPNYGTPGTGLRLEPGLVLAIEPMITLGKGDVRVLKDGWTVVTVDGLAAAHFEHTVALTENGPVILTKPD